MAGQQFVDVLAMGSIGTKGPTNAVRIAADASGILKTSVKGGAFTPIGAGGFGSDTIIQLPNSAAANVNALELVTSLPTNTAGSETSQFAIKTLDAGAVVTTALKGHQWLLQDGTAALPTLAFASRPTTGFYLDTTNNRVQVSIAGGLVAYVDGTPTLLLNGPLGGVNINSDSKLDRIGPNGDLRLFSAHDIVIGTSSALATTATSGFLQIPTCAGLPTGVVAAITGKACIVYDTTNNKLSANAGGGWKQSGAFV